MNDPTSETIVLAGICKNPKMFFELDGKISEQDFFEEEHQKLYKLFKHVIVDVQPEVVDEFICLTTAKDIGLNLKKTEKAALDIILERNVKKEALLSAAKTIKKISVKRFLSRILSEESDEILNHDGSVNEMLGGLEGRLFDAFTHLGTKEEGELTPISGKVFDYVKSLVGAKPVGLDLGFPQWQRAFGKIRNGSVNGIFARMKQGKSQLALQLAIRAAVFNNIPTLILDTELTEQMQMIRLAAQLAKVPYDLVEEGKWVNSHEYVKRMEEAEIMLRDKPIIYESISGMPIEEVVPIIRRFAMKFNSKPTITPQALVIYDYIKLPDIGQLNTANEYQILGAITSKLHDEAVRTNMPFFVVGQQNRSGAEADSITTIADSDKIARDIDSISIIRRKTERELNLDPSENGSHILKVLAARNGSGHLGDEYVNLHFDMSCGFMTEGKEFTHDKLQQLRDKVFEQEL